MIQKLPVYPAFEENNLPIVLESSDFFAPYASVTMLSIIEHTTPEHNYDFLVLTWDMKEETAQKLISMADGKENISIRVVDVAEKVKPYEDIAKKGKFFDKFSLVGIVRLMLPTLLEKYDVALNLDSDMLISADIEELFQYKLEGHYMGGVPDVMSYAMNHRPSEKVLTDDFLFNRLKLPAVSEYMNGGLWMLNLQKIRIDFTQSEIIEFAMEDGAFLTYCDQDAFNGLFAGNKVEFPIEWDWEIDTRGLILDGAKYLSSNDVLIKKYYAAEKNIKNYHYGTILKPWKSANVPYGDKWWETARRSVFFDEISSRSEGSAETADRKNGQRLLFACETPYELINILNVKYHYYPDVKADLLICSSSLSNCIDKIRKLNVFQEIIVTEYDSRTNYDEILAMPLAERTLEPEKYALLPRLSKRYTDYFFSFTRHHFLHMIYYSMINAGMLPDVHILEDGSSTYVDDLNFNDYKDIDQKLYPEKKRLQNRLTSLYLYKPSLYCGASKVRIIPLPSLSPDKAELVEMLLSIWGAIELPPQKYIFFNECMREEGLVTNEVQLLDAVSEIVGKENIAIKIHPRSTNMEKIYQMHGYYVMLNSTVPWELAAFSPSMDRKILMSISSNTIWTPLILSGVNNRTISLCEVMKLSQRVHARTPKYRKFLSKIRTVANKDEVRFYMPNTQLELKNVIRYIEGEA